MICSVPASAVAGVAELRQRAAAALEVARRDVVENELAVDQMAPSEAILDLRLAIGQPVHRTVEIVLVRVGDPELLGQRRLAERADGRELGRRRDRALADHRQRQVPLTRRLSDQAAGPGPAVALIAKRRPHMPGRQRPLDLERVSQHATSGSPRSPARISSISSAGRCERFADRLAS